VDRVRDELLAGTRLAANQHRGVRLRDLRDLLVHLPRRATRADDVREVVALAQLLPQVRVLVEQAPPLLLDHLLHVERLPEDRADDAEELHAAVVIALRFEAEIDSERADGDTVQDDRHADEAQLLLAVIGPARREVEKCRLLADARHHDRLAALDNLAGDPFADLEADRSSAIFESLYRFDVQLIFTQQRDHAAHDAVMTNEGLQHALHPGLQVEGP
jgi:hypothetical protein